MTSMIEPHAARRGHGHLSVVNLLRSPREEISRDGRGLAAC
jgi:hypothetical protein